MSSSDPDVELLPWGPTPRHLRAELRFANRRAKALVEEIRGQRGIVVAADQQLFELTSQLTELVDAVMTTLDRHLGPLPPEVKEPAS